MCCTLLFVALYGGLMFLTVHVHLDEQRFSLRSSPLKEALYRGKALHQDPLADQSLRHSNQAQSVVKTMISNEESAPPFGKVMCEFTDRVFSRHISQSNILLISATAVADAKVAVMASKEDSAKCNASRGCQFLRRAVEQGHTIHAVQAREVGTPELRTLNQWWRSFGSPDTRRKQDQEEPKQWWSFDPHNDDSEIHQFPSMTTHARPQWILAAMIDLPFGSEDTLWEKEDEFDEFLLETTITYVVLTVHSHKNPMNVIQGEQKKGAYSVGGLTAAQRLLDQRYKLQTLQVSHYHTSQGKNYDSFIEYGPNAMFPSRQRLEAMLQWGADGASQEELGSTSNSKVFTAYLFGTQGLDLAIPSSQTHLMKQPSDRSAPSLQTIHGPSKSTGLAQCPQANLSTRLRVAFVPCNSTDTKIPTSLFETALQVSLSTANSSKSSMLRFYFDGTSGGKPEYIDESPAAKSRFQQEEIDIWYNEDTIDRSEAACFRMGKVSHCTSRILVSKQSNIPAHQITNAQSSERLNLLLILIDPVSKAHFQRTMPKTQALLESLDFHHFSRYTAVGANSGPNQAALYSGIPLAGRQGIRSSDNQGKVWLWDRLKENGYTTFKSEDGCVLNSNMLQSLTPNTTHGEAFLSMPCFTFDRPNCIGPELAASKLLAHADQFVSSYERRRKESDLSSRWAAFVHLIDSHEDSMILSEMLDEPLSAFLEKMHNEGHLDHAAVVVTSDHGLHYGSYRQTEQGSKEAVDPILYLTVPGSKVLSDHVLQSNTDLWTTAFDVHETLVEMTQSSGSGSIIQNPLLGSSLLQRLEGRDSCLSTTAIPPSYCELSQAHADCHQSGIRAPSLASFFFDIQREHFSKLVGCLDACADSMSVGAKVLCFCHRETDRRSQCFAEIAHCETTCLLEMSSVQAKQ